MFFVTQVVAETHEHRLVPDKTLIVGVNRSFAPYEFINKEGVPDGYTVDLIKAVADILGIKVTLILDDWKHIQEGLAASQFDVVSGMLYSKERDRSFDYSISHSIVSYSLFIRNGSTVRQLDDLKGKEVIVVENVYAHEWLKENTPQAILIKVESSIDALKLLASGKHDSTILPRLHGLDLIKELEIPNVEIIGSAILEQKFCFAVANGRSDILADLNDALFTLQMSGKYEEIYLKWFSVEEEQKNFTRFLSYVVPVAVVIGILFVVFIAWNWSLRRSVGRKTAEIEKSRQRLHQILEGIAVPTFVVDCQGDLTHWNKACEVLTGRPEKSVVGTKEYRQLLYPGKTKSLVELLLEDRLEKDRHQYNGITCRRSRFLKEAYETELYFDEQGIDGQWVYVAAATLRDGTGKKLGVIESRQDLTEVKQLESQLIQSQKMEALGTLAGGVAHDFNNILTSIIGTTELVSRKFETDLELQQYLSIILSGGRRGKELTGQILAFSSKATIHPQQVSVTAIAEEAVAFVASTCPSIIVIKSDIKPTEEVAADPTHIHQVIMNLCTNAIYAMRESGGVLEICLENYTLQQEALVPADLTPGEYVRLQVKDNGPGMEERVLKRIFDPFFTTKERGEGTGMGLSVSAGIIKQYGGSITCTAQPGSGTDFKVLLPSIVDGNI